MKKILFGLLLLLGVSCNKAQEVMDPLTEAQDKTRILMNEIKQEMEDSTAVIQDNTIEKVEQILEELHCVVRHSDNMDESRASKVVGYLLLQKLLQREHGISSEQRERLIPKMDQLQYTFQINEDGGRTVFKLLNVFLPQYRDIDLYGEFFYLFIYFNSTTGKFENMGIHLPSYFADKDVKPSFRVTIMDPEESSTALDLVDPKLTYLEELGSWIADFSVEDFAMMLSRSTLFLAVCENEDWDHAEISSIKLASFKKQYVDFLHKVYLPEKE